jgi:RNA polymerase sigma-70 factor (ECF subfamily)
MDLANLTDADLLDQWRAGDKRAGDALTARHYAPVQKFVRRKLDDRAAIQEIVQETWLALLEGRENIREGLKFRGFLNCIASRRVYKWYQSRGLEREFDPEQMSLAEASSSLPVRLQIKRAETKLLYRALRELPAEEQLTLELFNWEELSAPDIAELMNVSLPTVKHRLRRGRERLAALIAGYQQQPGHEAVDTRELLDWFADLQRRGANLDAERK